MTQAQLAGRLGIHQTALSRLERRNDVSLSMLKSFVEALGGNLEISAMFPDAAIALSKIADVHPINDLRALEWQQCLIHPIPPERATDRFLVRKVDEALIHLEKLSNKQLLKIPVRRILEILRVPSEELPLLVLRGSLKWSANEKLWRVSLD